LADNAPLNKSFLQIFTNTVIYFGDNFIINQIFTFDKKNNIFISDSSNKSLKYDITFVFG